MRTGIILFAHGSGIESANAAVRAVAREMARAGGYPLVETAFLEMARPSLAEAVESLAARGASQIVIVPYFLVMGVHLQEDLPQLALDLARRHERLNIRVAQPLDGHPALLQIVLDRISEALAGD